MTKTEELLERHPKVTNIIKQWMTERMLESLVDESIPEEFKEDLRKEQIENVNLIPIIDANPRALFDVFDENNIYINIHAHPTEPVRFSYTIHSGNLGENSEEANYATRKFAERDAIERAFEILEVSL